MSSRISIRLTVDNFIVIYYAIYLLSCPTPGDVIPVGICPTPGVLEGRSLLNQKLHIASIGSFRSITKFYGTIRERPLPVSNSLLRNGRVTFSKSRS